MLYMNMKYTRRLLSSEAHGAKTLLEVVLESHPSFHNDNTLTEDNLGVVTNLRDHKDGNKDHEESSCAGLRWTAE